MLRRHHSEAPPSSSILPVCEKSPSSSPKSMTGNPRFHSGDLLCLLLVTASPSSRRTDLQRLLPVAAIALDAPIPSDAPFQRPRPSSPVIASKGWKKREADDVGLAIVAAHDKSGPISHRSSKIVIAEQKSSPPKSAAEDFLRGEVILLMECMYTQIVSDECMEKCVFGVLIRQPEIPSAPCSGDRRLLFSARMMAL
ncbi:hypothetical protein KSP40_PGU022210 [Platanthera guangdongensis]|uniref:Uncharacterized protein n=1 Tax=Platanthera guangdongensis TaxID=2320717 RepID=A0ABR2MED0_9ASPA